MFKTPTSQEITDKAIELINKNGSTNNLSIKLALRHEGFWVFQSDISKVMNGDLSGIGISLTNNGSYNTYFESAPVSDDDEDDDDSLELESDEIEHEDEEPEAVATIEPEVEKTKKSKIVGQPELVGTDTYLVVMETEDVETDLIISKESSLPKHFGTLIYEVKSKNGGDNWYLYSNDSEFITRHKALYYVWKVLNFGVDSTILYSELRSTKLNK